MNNALLYFLAIPKTASTTFFHILCLYFNQSRIVPAQSLSQFLATPQSILDGYQLIAGHFFYQIERVLGRAPVYLTLLRDPVQRALSHYYHIRRLPEHYAHERVVRQSLSEYVRDERNRPLFSNLQTRYLGLNRDLLGMYASLDAAALARGELVRQAEAYIIGTYDDKSMLETARARLKNFAFVGITEHFDESVCLLCRTFGWQKPETYTHYLVNPNTEAEVDPEVLEILEQANTLDQALYNEYRALFEEQI